MNYCFIGTETIIHYINKETFSFSTFFILSEGLSDTEKLFLLLKHKTDTETVHSRYMFISTYIVDLLHGHGPICVINKTVSLYTRACSFTTRIVSFLFKIFIFEQTKKYHLHFSFTYSRFSRMVRRLG